MSKHAQQSKKIPEPVLKAQAVLEILRAENPDTAEDLAKILPIYAIQQNKAGETVTEKTLLDDARKGADYLKQNSGKKNGGKDKKPQDILETYRQILKDLPEDDRKTDTGEQIRENTAEITQPQKQKKPKKHVSHDRALIAAAPQASAEEIAALIEKGADPKAKLSKAMREAANAKNWGATAFLIEQGARKHLLLPKEKRAVEDYTKSAQKWQKKLRIAPPHGLHEDNPEFFKKSAFEATLKLLAEEGIGGAEANKAAFRLSGLLQSEQRVLQYLKQWGKKGETPLYTLSQDIRLPRPPGAKEENDAPPLQPLDAMTAWVTGIFEKEEPQPEPVTPNIKDWGDAVLKCGPSMAGLVKFSRFVASPQKSSDGKTWSTQSTRAECAKHLYKRAMNYPDLAELCYRYGVKQKHYEQALKLIEKRKIPKKRMPDLTIDGEKFNLPGGKFRRLSHDDFQGLFLGEMTACCQSIGKVGAACAKHGYVSENGGFYVVESAKGDIIGQSWAWRGKKGELCFDSLETLGDRLSPEQWAELLKAAANELTEKQNRHDVTALHIGAGGRTPKELKKVFKDSAKARPKDFGFFRHRDSRFSQLRVWKRTA